MTVMAQQMTPGSARMLRQQAPTAMQVHRAGCRLQPSVHRLHRRTQRTIVRAAETQDKQTEKKVCLWWRQLTCLDQCTRHPPGSVFSIYTCAVLYAHLCCRSTQLTSNSQSIAVAPPLQEKLVENFKKGGLDKSTAQRVLDMWKQTGASDEEGLKKLLVRRCVPVVHISVCT
jgi:hypothetical protein